MSNLMATQRDCFILSNNAEEPTQYEEHRLATAAYARGLAVYHGSYADNRVVRRADLYKKWQEITDVDMEADATFISQTFYSATRSYTESRFAHPEVHGDDERNMDLALPNDELLIRKVEGDEVGAVELKTSGSSRDMYLKVTTPDGLDSERQCTYEVYSRNGEFSYKTYIHLNYAEIGFPIQLVVSCSNEYYPYGYDVVINGDTYAVEPGQTKEFTKTIYARDMCVKHTGYEDVGLPILLSKATGGGYVWGFEMNDTWTDVDPWPEGESGNVSSLLKFASKESMEEMYEEYLRAGSVALYMDVSLVPE